MIRRAMVFWMAILLASVLPLGRVGATAEPPTTPNPIIRAWQLAFTVNGDRIKVNGTMQFSSPLSGSLTVPLPPGYQGLVVSPPAGPVQVGPREAVVNPQGNTMGYSFTLPKKGRYLLWPVTLNWPVDSVIVYTGPGITFPVILNQEFWSQDDVTNNGTTYQVAASKPLSAGKPLHLLFELPPKSDSSIQPETAGNAMALASMGVTMAVILVIFGFWLVRWWRRATGKQGGGEPPKS